MKHKGARNIPDFSQKPKTPHPVAPDRKGAAATPHGRPVQPKPQATSAKSGGRRGA